jgi:hypothetical protein
LGFGHLFQVGVSSLQKAIHVALKEEHIGDPPQQAEWRSIVEGLIYQCSAVGLAEAMGVAKPLEGALHHFVNKAVRPVKLCDLRGEPLADPEVDTGDGRFPGLCGGLGVKVDVA